MEAHEARVNITYNGENFDLPDPVHFQAGDGDIKAWVTEAIRTGSVRGVVADAQVDLVNYMVDRFNASAIRDHNLIQVRPKTAYGEEPTTEERNYDALCRSLQVEDSGSTIH